MVRVEQGHCTTSSAVAGPPTDPPGSCAGGPLEANRRHTLLPDSALPWAYGCGAATAAQELSQGVSSHPVSDVCYKFFCHLFSSSAVAPAHCPVSRVHNCAELAHPWLVLVLVMVLVLPPMLSALLLELGATASYRGFWCPPPPARHHLCLSPSVRRPHRWKSSRVRRCSTRAPLRWGVRHST